MLKRYRSHKVVEAAKIVLVFGKGTVDDLGVVACVGGDWALMLEDGSNVPLAAKHDPEVGGYFVRYDDGYTSYSPAAAFEAGYALEEMEGAVMPATNDEPSAGPFRFSQFNKRSGAPIESIADVVEVMASSAEGGRPELFGVALEEEDDRGLSRVVCYTGNGPRSAANARLITWLLEHQLGADSFEQIARCCHEVNRAFCLAMGEDPALVYAPWSEAPEEIRRSARVGVAKALDGATPAALHESWCATKRADGWSFGEVKNLERREHPCLVPYDRLPAVQQTKDALFLAVVHAFDRAVPASV